MKLAVNCNCNEIDSIGFIRFIQRYLKYSNYWRACDIDILIIKFYIALCRYFGNLHCEPVTFNKSARDKASPANKL